MSGPSTVPRTSAHLRGASRTGLPEPGLEQLRGQMARYSFWPGRSELDGHAPKR